MYNQIAKVAVENATYSFDDAFDYAIPQALASKVQPGVRVLVPFGNGNKKRQGFVFALRQPKDGKKLKAISKISHKCVRIIVDMKSYNEVSSLDEENRDDVDLYCDFLKE